MKLKLTGYEFAPRQQHQAAMADYMAKSQTGGWAGELPPAAATPIYTNEAGDHFMALPDDNGVGAVTFIPGSAAEKSPDGRVGDLGGFVPIEEMPQVGGGSPLNGIMANALGGLSGDAVGDWFGNAATEAMLGAAPGGALDTAMKTLGLTNPLAGGPLGSAMAAAASAAGGLGGLGNAGGLLAQALGGGTGGLGNMLGRQGMNALKNATGLGGLPCVGAVANMLGGQLGQQLTGLFSGGGPTGGLDNAADMINNIMPGGCTMFGQGGGNFDLKAVTADALDQASDQLLSQWQVDDESSAGETIAHKFVNDNKEKIKEAVKDPNGFIEGIQKFFAGEPVTPGMPVARILDKDSLVDVIAMGLANILVEKFPVSRITDTLLPSTKPILEGAATVLSAELPTAFLTAKTAVPSVIAKGAATVFVGGALAAIDPPATKDAPENQSNDGPTGPDGPASTSSGSGEGGGESMEGEENDTAKPGETPADTDDSNSSDSDSGKSESGDGDKEVAEGNENGVAKSDATPSQTETEEKEELAQSQDGTEDGNIDPDRTGFEPSTDNMEDGGINESETSDEKVARLQKEDQRLQQEEQNILNQMSPEVREALEKPPQSTAKNQEYECATLSEDAQLVVGGSEGIMFCKGPDGQIHRYHYTQPGASADASLTFDYGTGVISMPSPESLDGTSAFCVGGGAALGIGAHGQYCWSSDPNVNVGLSSGLSIGLGVGVEVGSANYSYQGSYDRFEDALLKTNRKK
ncbi:MAG: hypothetical protein JW829_11085 [Pirellulales bacterium]|nr:hypothetical protein [Pirellulales bacterium]